MKKYEVINEFYDLRNGTRKTINFSKGYEVFEEVYNEYKDKFNLKRKEIKHVGYTEVIITR